jgi:hypothetical protein
MRRPASQLRPLNFSECAQIAAHLRPIHQLVLWLQRVMGLRISEAFDGLVDDVIDLGDSRLLMVRSEGGRVFRVRDDEGRVVAVPHNFSRQFREESLDFVKGIAGLCGLLRVLDAVSQSAGDQPEADLLECLDGGTELGHDIAALTALGQHRLDSLDLPTGTLEPKAKIVDHLVRQLHGVSFCRP